MSKSKPSDEVKKPAAENPAASAAEETVEAGSTEASELEEVTRGEDSTEQASADGPPEEVPLSLPSPTELKELRTKADESDTYKDNWLRSVADLKNFQKRLIKEKEQARKFAKRDLVSSLLPSFDNLGRAVQSADPEAAKKDPVVMGVTMVSEEIKRILGDHGIRVVNPEGEPLDPNLHEAVASFPSDEVEEGRIIHVMEKGYTMGELVIRPARVSVSLGNVEETPDEQPSDETEED